MVDGSSVPESDTANQQSENADDTEARAPGRDWVRVGLIGSVLLAVVFVGLLMPAFAADGLAGTPIDRVLPGEAAESPEAEVSGGPGTDGGSLGALNPGERTGVGGEIGLDSETFGNTDTELHFTVEATEGTYWRTGSYDTYTGAGWERPTETEPLDGGLTHDGQTASQIEYELTLEKTATAVPTPWQPTVVEGVDEPLVTEDRAIRTDIPLEPRSTVSGVSHSPERDPDILNNAGSSYPDGLFDQYTQLPDDTPSRVGSLTDEITADAETPYEQAVAIEEWLEESKEYDLDVSEEGDNIADTFIFEMDAGYCEYFATAMTTMLRTQDIPTRYVVGYSTGQQVDDGVYEVRAMNAHAWVEVYFPDIGWVRFDPTPGSERLAAQEEALDELDGEFDLGEEGSPGEELNPDDLIPDPEPGDDGGLDISLNRTAVPGEAVEVAVTWNEFPVPGVEVLFNGEPIEITDDAGTVTGTVPDTEELDITVRAPEDGEGDIILPPVFEESDEGSGEPRDFEDEESDEFDDHEDEERDVSEDDSTDAVAEPSQVTSISRTEFLPSVGAATQDSGSEVVSGRVMTTPASEDGSLSLEHRDDRPEMQSQTQNSSDPGETHPVETTATISFSGDIGVGEELTATVRASDISLSDATVRVDGDVAGTTDENGQLSFTLPESTGDVVIEAERGIVYGTETIRIPELTVDVEGGSYGTFALSSVTVEATLDGESAAGVPVVLDGEQVATTGTDGNATVQLPLSHGVAVGAQTAGQTQTETLTGLLYVPLGVVGVGGAVLLSLFYMAYSPAYSLRRIPHNLVRLPGRVVSVTSLLLVTIATDTDRLWMACKHRIHRLKRAVRGLSTGETRPQNIGSRFRGFGAALLGLFGRKETSSRGAIDGQPTAQEAWQRFLDDLSVPNPATRTPGEIATHAIERDNLPERPVETLRDTFRAAEYGPGTAVADGRQLEAALGELEATAEGSDAERTDAEHTEDSDAEGSDADGEN